MKWYAIISIALAISFVIPSVSAVGIFGDRDVYTFFFDEDLFNRTKPGIVGEKPEIVYWRFAQVQGQPDYMYLTIFFYWEYQYHYIAPHDYDWEWYVVKMDSDGNAIKSAFPEWHYIIGRNDVPRMYNGTHTFVNIGPDNHPVTQYENNTFGATVKNGLDYSGFEVKRMDNSILKRAAEEVGFDERLMNDPELYFESGWIREYKRFSAFRSWRRSFLVYIDRNLDWVDFSKE